MLTAIVKRGINFERFWSDCKEIYGVFYDFRLSYLTAGLFVWLVLNPLTTLHETRVDVDSLMGEKILIERMGDFDKTLKNKPAKDEYFLILRQYMELNAQCQAYNELNRNSLRLASRSGVIHVQSTCSRVMTLQIEFDYQNYINEVQFPGDGSGLKQAKAVYAEQYGDYVPEDIMKISYIEHIWRLGQLLWSQFGMWFMAHIFFIRRLRKAGVIVKWEVLSGKMLVWSFFWIIGFWYYKTKPADQIRGIKLLLSMIFAPIFSLFSSTGAWAGEKDWSTSAGIGVKSSAVFDNNYTANESWVFQGWGNLSHSDSGVYFGVWGSKGLESNRGDEIDYTVGFGHSFSKWATKIDLSYSYYQIIDGINIHAPQVKVCTDGMERTSICVKLKNLIPEQGFESGMSYDLNMGYSWKPYQIQTEVNLNYSVGAFSSPPTTVLSGKLTLPLSKTGLVVFVRGFLPLNKEAGDPQGLMGLQLTF